MIENGHHISGSDITNQDISELIDLLQNLYGYDFSEYSKASFKRRVIRILQKFQVNFFNLKQMLINQKDFAEEFVANITVNVTEMFRDPDFFAAFRREAIPYLKSFPQVKIWNAGCATGEEVYSFAIMMDSEGLLDKTFIYGTDLSVSALENARKGFYSLRQMKSYSENFLKSGSNSSLSNYYTAAYEAATIQQRIKEKTFFAIHNLVSDGVFNEFQVVVCRNVLIYFEEKLQQKVISLLYESLCPLGYLCLGSKESLRFSSLKIKFRVVDQHQNIFQKIE